MKKFIIISFYLIFISGSVIAENIESSANNLFHIGQMNSHNKNFALFFKTRDKAILARGGIIIMLQIFLKTCIFIIIKQKFHHH